MVPEIPFCRDVENDSTLFQLVILAGGEPEEGHHSFNTQDTLDSVQDFMGGAALDSGRRSSLKTKVSGMSRRSFRRSDSAAYYEQKVFQFHVLLDGNEKYVWLQAAAELGRLLAPITIDARK